MAKPGPNQDDAGAGRKARDKILPLSRLAVVCGELRDAGETVVLCHGVFDLLHLGHVRHLEEARRHGTRLVVTVTADRFVNKGPGRPVFTAELRAEMLAAVEYVDWVAINDEPSAEPVLSAVRPSVYVKGSDYTNAADDITGKIAAEREMVESLGGRLVFTNDITFSSSNLLNRYFSAGDTSARQYIEENRSLLSYDRMAATIDSIRDMRVLFIGDAIIDEYCYVTPMNKSPKENMIATLYQSRELFAGGVLAAANHAASLCHDVTVLTVVGGDREYADLLAGSLKPNVTLKTVTRPEFPTTRKTRFIDASYSMRKLFEVYTMDDSPIDAAAERQLLAQLASLDQYDVVVVTDFGHGMMTPAVIETLVGGARFLAVNAQSNSANLGFNLVTKYPRADYVCIDGPEARLAVHEKYGAIEDIIQNRLPRQMACERIVITQGKHGCLVYQAGQGIERVPALTNSIVDTVGAGDAFFAITAPIAATGAPMRDIGLIGNAAGAMKVGIVGHRQSVEKIPLLRFIGTLLK